MKTTYYFIFLFIFATQTTAQTNQADSISFATVIFYRAYIPPMHAPVKKVPVYINDTLVHRLKANTIFTQKLNSPGKFRIAIDEKGETTIPLKAKSGTVSYFKCEVANGLWFGKPVIRAVPADIGAAECEVITVKTATSK